MGAYNSKEEPTVEEPTAKKRRLEPPKAEQIQGTGALRCVFLEQIIENQQKDIENLRAEIASKDKRIQAYEDHLKHKNLESLPNECLLKIMSYLSNYDILRNIAGISKRFHELSGDKHLIRKIEVDSKTWTRIQESGINMLDFRRVLKRSVKLTFLSLDFGVHRGEKFLQALPMMNHQFLKELCLKGDGRSELHDATYFLHPGCPILYPWNENLLIYLEKCSKLKVLKFEFKPKVQDSDSVPDFIMYPFLSWIEETISRFKLKNLQELHLSCLDIDLPKSAFKKLLEKIAKNMPKLQHLCLMAEVENTDQYGEWDDFAKICGAFASQNNIKLEIRDLPIPCNFDGGIKSVCCGRLLVHPSKVVKIYGPK